MFEYNFNIYLDAAYGYVILNKMCIDTHYRELDLCVNHMTRNISKKKKAIK